MDSISALALKVLLAYNNEKNVSQNRVFIRSRDPNLPKDDLYFINTVCKHCDRARIQTKAKIFLPKRRADFEEILLQSPCF